MHKKPIKILLIEDNQGDARLVQEMLKGSDAGQFELERADCLSSGLDRLSEKCFDVLLLDLGLPDSQGLHTLTGILTKAPKIPVVVLTGIADEKMGVKVVLEGAQEYLTKDQLCGNLLIRSVLSAIVRKQMEEILQKNEEKYRTLVEEINEGLYIVDDKGTFTFANKALAAIHGVDTPDELIGKSFEAFINPEIREKIMELFRASINTAKFPEVIEVPIIKEKNKSLVFVEIRPIPVIKEGCVIGSKGIVRDITERKWIERELRKHHDQLEKLVEERTAELKTMNERLQQEISERKQLEEELYKITDQLKKAQQIAHIGSWDWNVHTNSISWSEELYQIFGLTPGEFVPRYDGMLGLVHPDDRELVEYSIKEESLKKGKPYNIEHRIIRLDGSVRIIKAQGEVIRDKKGNPIRMVGTGEDITERKQIEDEKERLYEQLHHARRLESVGKLAGAIAHDFNNILSGIIGYGELLLGNIKKGNLSNDDSSRDYIQRLLATAERATSLIQGLLTFSRKQVTDLKPVNLNRLIKKAENIVLGFIRKDIKLKITLTGKDCVVMADGGQMERVLMNLAVNAKDAMPDGGLISIGTDVVKIDNEFKKTHGYGEVGWYAHISFSDTGVGMTEETKKKIFEPFFTTKKSGKGTGLGLSIVYAIVKQHRGYINVFSEPGKGTRVEIYLPVIESEVEEVRPEDVPTPAGGTETILLAEDDDDVRKLTKTVLEGAGYRVIDAVDGEDAIDKFMKNKDRIQLLILDVMMPKKDGKEVYDEIRKARQDINALFVSGYAEDVIDKKRIREEGLHFISKPVLPTMLLRKIRELLDK